MQNVKIFSCSDKLKIIRYYFFYQYSLIKFTIKLDFIKQITILRDNKINSICRSNLQALLMLNKFENETWNLSNATLFTWLTDDDCKREEWKGDIKICSKSRISFVRKNYTLQTSHRISRMRNLWITRADFTEDFDLLKLRIFRISLLCDDIICRKLFQSSTISVERFWIFSAHHMTSSSFMQFNAYFIYYFH